MIARCQKETEENQRSCRSTIRRKRREKEAAPSQKESMQKGSRADRAVRYNTDREFADKTISEF
jgi:hypothetical protein